MTTTTTTLADSVKWDGWWLWMSVATIVFNPVAWNIVARNEHRKLTLTRVFGSAHRGWMVLCTLIIAAGAVRGYAFYRALEEQSQWTVLASIPMLSSIALLVRGIGMVLVAAAYYRLGLKGVYLGDYFGFLMDHRVEGFPFNVVDDPIYVGSTLNHVGEALAYASPAGLMLSVVVYVVYAVAVALFERPFTDMIYATRATLRSSRESLRTSRTSRPTRATRRTRRLHS